MRNFKKNLNKLITFFIDKKGNINMIMPLIKKV